MDTPAFPIILNEVRIPVITVTDDAGNTRPAEPGEMLAHVLASQLRTEQLVHDMANRVGPTLEGLASHPLLGKFLRN